MLPARGPGGPAFLLLAPVLAMIFLANLGLSLNRACCSRGRGRGGDRRGRRRGGGGGVGGSRGGRRGRRRGRLRSNGLSCQIAGENLGQSG